MDVVKWGRMLVDVNGTFYGRVGWFEWRKKMDSVNKNFVCMMRVTGFRVPWLTVNEEGRVTEVTPSVRPDDAKFYTSMKKRQSQ